jgi:opacity protein-like surface antigen
VNWTGFYVGAFGGAALGTADWNYGAGEVSPHIGGFLGGAEIGYNYQINSWVVGLDGDLGGMNTKGGTACGPALNGGIAGDNVFANPSPMYQMTCNASATWLATATAKLGYSWGRTLWYVKAGGAWTDEKFSATCNLGVLQATNPTGQMCINPANALSTGFSASTNRGGWTVGYGGEFALTQNWSAKAETDYVSFGDTNLTASDGSRLKVGMHYWTSKVGVDYHFNAGL